MTISTTGFKSNDLLTESIKVNIKYVSIKSNMILYLNDLACSIADDIQNILAT